MPFHASKTLHLVLALMVQSYWKKGNFEEQLPKKPVGRLSINCQPTDAQQLADCWPSVGDSKTLLTALIAEKISEVFEGTVDNFNENYFEMVISLIAFSFNC